MERNLAVLIDFENIATGCEKEGLGRFDVKLVMRRLKDKGRILVARSYADWGRWSRFKQDLVGQGVMMVELTTHGMQSKNRADIALVVDAMELAYTRDYVDTFVVLSGDSDFTPLVMRLKELNKRVIGCGTRGSTSRLIAELCDEFFFYDTLKQEARKVEARVEPRPSREEEEEEEEEIRRAEEDERVPAKALTLDQAFALLVETVVNHQRDEAAPVSAGVLKTSMKRKAPTFSEEDLGMRTFARFLESAAKRGLVTLLRDERGGGYRVDLPQAAAETIPAEAREPVGSHARTLLGILAEEGLEVAGPVERRAVVRELVAVCDERARRNRKCAVQWVLGDLLRRVRVAHPDLSTRTAKGVVNALVRAGLLIHPDGTPVRTAVAPFQPPESAASLLDGLDRFSRSVLAAHGVDVRSEGVAELFPEHGAEPPLPPIADDVFVDDVGVIEEPAVEEAPAEKRPRRPRRKKGEEVAAEAPAPDAAEFALGTDSTDLPAAGDDGGEESGDEAGAEAGDQAGPASPRKRTRRGGRRGRKGAASSAEE